ncbi:GNAT family N-acetyltransferase [Silvibacterium acidisoli]|uniref:GNAT family N-acetyltransferase n=1 Tax=Acidobacteriaceae bacterium ZG23-2 TaxID=2883246 RepID=UPI00406D151A
MFRLRPLISSDIDAICHHREAMFRDMGTDESTLQAMEAPFRAWLEPRLLDGRYFGFMAEVEGKTIGGAGLMELDWPPHASHPTDHRRGYILNVYVEPEFRGQGIAKALLDAADKEFQGRGLVYAVLHATEMGRPIYEHRGWKPTTEMSRRYSGSDLK